MALEIRDFDAELHGAFVASLWNSVLPAWAIPSAQLTTLLSRRGHHFVAFLNGIPIAFCITYSISATKSGLSNLVVTPTYQNQGHGSAILSHVLKTLSAASPALQIITLGSTFPRFWPGLPINLPARDREFFAKRGFKRTAEASARDLFQDITRFEIEQEVGERAAAAGWSAAPWSKEGEEECLAKQRMNFGHNADWIRAYEALAAAGQHSDVTVIYNAEGEQIAWTLACSPHSAIAQGFAFLQLAGESVGLIACVGVDKEARGGGVGRFLLAAAMQDLKRRGVNGVFIDWVVIRGFYEKAGFEVWGEYEGWELSV